MAEGKTAKSLSELDRNFVLSSALPGKWRWRDGRSACFSLSGLGWPEENGNAYGRWPLRAQKVVRPEVWSLGCNSASVCIRFASDATALAVRVGLAGGGVMPHMPASGSNGVAVHLADSLGLRHVATAIPNAGDKFYERLPLNGMARGWREYRLYLPLYNSVERLEIGLPPEAKIRKPSAFALPRPVVVYGSSITQGGCASTPGADWVSSVGRELNLEMLNFGFSGNGTGDPEVAKLLAELDPALYVLDYAANADNVRLRKTLPTFLKILRVAHPDTPVALVSRTPYGGDHSVSNTLSAYGYAATAKGVLNESERRRDVMLEFYIKQRKAGDTQLHFIDGNALLPFGGSALTVDGVHPTDHGFQVITAAIAPQIRRILF